MAASMLSLPTASAFTNWLYGFNSPCSDAPPSSGISNHVLYQNRTEPVDSARTPGRLSCTHLVITYSTRFSCVDLGGSTFQAVLTYFTPGNRHAIASAAAPT